MAEPTWERVKDPADPNRCQSLDSKGQCINKATEGGKYCMTHGGVQAAIAEARVEQRMYNAGKWRAAISKFQDHDKLKSLREEIGILRIMIDERLKLCHDPMDLMLYSGPLADMIVKVEKLVLSCNKIEMHLSGVLDHTQALQLAQEMVGIIGRHLDTIVDKEKILSVIKDFDPDIIDSVSDVLADSKTKEEVLDCIANDIVATVERLGKSD